MGELISLEKLKYVKVADIAKILNVSKMTVYRIINSGELPAVRFGRTFRVAENELEEYLKSCRVKPGELQWANQIMDDDAHIPVEDD